MAISAWVNLANGDGEPDWAALARQFCACRRTFILHVPSWQGYTPLTALTWHRIKYQSNQWPVQNRGVYAFVLDSGRLAPGHFPPHSTVLYVGETGNTGQGTLKSRLQGYRNKKAQRDRARLWSILEQWGPHLLFYYATVPPAVSTKDCETALLDALLPPANAKDFSATVTQARNYAFQN